MNYTPGPWQYDTGFVYALNEDGVNRFSASFSGGYTHGGHHRLSHHVNTTPSEVNANSDVKKSGDTVSERKRVWGLYSLRYKTWRSVGGAFIKDVRKRDTFGNFQCALECAQGFKLDDAEVVPRPFYIVKKPRGLSADVRHALEVIITDTHTSASYIDLYVRRQFAKSIENRIRGILDGNVK